MIISAKQIAAFMTAKHASIVITIDPVPILFSEKLFSRERTHFMSC